MFGRLSDRIRFKKRNLTEEPPAGYSYIAACNSLQYYDPDRWIYRVVVDGNGLIRESPGFVPEVYLDTAQFPKLPAPRVAFRCDYYRLDDGRVLFLWTVQPDGRYWADADGFGAENDEEIVLYSVLKDGRLTTPFRFYSVGMNQCFDPEEGLDEEKERQRWNETVRMIVRLAFCGKVYRTDGHYAIRTGIATMPLAGTHTLTDVCVQYRRFGEKVRASIEAEYARAWSAERVAQMVRDPEAYLPQTEEVCAHLRTEPAQMKDRPIVPEELFWICPRRTSLLALEIAEEDLKNMR